MLKSSISHKKNKAIIGGRIRPINLLQNWLHQGFLYLDSTERFGRAFYELIPSVILSLFLSLNFEIPFLSLSLWIWVVFTIHTINWIVNDNWWACILFTFPQLKNPGERATCLYLNGMAERLKNRHSISGVMIFGSISRNQWHERSDLDVRFLRKGGVFNGIKAVLITSCERLIAFLVKQPLDVYLADDVTFFKKMRVDEYPIFLKKDDQRLNDFYPTNGECRFIALKTY